MSTSTSSQPAILVLGGTGTVGSRIVRQLASFSHPTPPAILVASRSGKENSGDTSKPDTSSASFASSSQNNTSKSNTRHVAFDWHDTDTWDGPFSARISAIYLIAPPSLNAEGLMMEFVDFARERGVRRFVLQSASSIEPGGPAMGKVHSYLRELGQRGEVEWAVLRPTWFQQNFASQPTHLRSIKEESKIYSATGEGKIPWVSADDIAAVAVRALTDAQAPNTEYMVLGPELLSYGDIASILSELLKRRIVHVDLSAAELEERHQKFGMPEDYARMMSAMDTSIKFGAESRTNDAVLAITGSTPRKFADFARSVKGVWETGGRF